MHDANSIRNSKPGLTKFAKCNLTFVVVFPKYGMENYILGLTAIYIYIYSLCSLCFLAFLHKLTLLIHIHSNLEIAKLSFTYTPQGLLSMLYAVYSARNDNWLPLPPFLLAPLPSPTYLSLLCFPSEKNRPPRVITRNRHTTVK